MKKKKEQEERKARAMAEVKKNVTCELFSLPLKVDVSNVASLEFSSGELGKREKFATKLALKTIGQHLFAGFPNFSTNHMRSQQSHEHLCLLDVMGYVLLCSKKNEIAKDQPPRNSFTIINPFQRRKTAGKVARQITEVNSTI